MVDARRFFGIVRAIRHLERSDLNMITDMPLTMRKIADPEDFKLVYPIIKELRPNLEYADFLSLSEAAADRDDYQIVADFDGNSCIGAMGYRILFDFVHGKHLYIDDLVVTQSRRSEGVGERLLRYAEDKARELGCKGLRLCTGIDNEGGKKFYERHGWAARAFAYKKRLS
jgi:GNAT superfamily N-acetyltransferase